MKFSRQQFVDQEIDLDGNEFSECRFEQCQLIYRGGPIPALVNCEFIDVGWQFSDAASNTLQFMGGLYHGGGEGGRLLIEQTINSLIADPAQQTPPPARGRPNLRIVREDDEDNGN